MSLNNTPSASRTVVTIFGKCNSGKSTLINAICNQNVSIVSSYRGTTTDPVSRAIELLPLGPALIIDTPGFDDNENELSTQRVSRVQQTIKKTDIALFVGSKNLGNDEIEFCKALLSAKIPLIIVKNIRLDDKAAIYGQTSQSLELKDAVEINVDALEGKGITELKNLLAAQSKSERENPILGDLIVPKDVVVLVIPIDSSAPKGRLILPQQQVLRELLNLEAISISVQPSGLTHTLNSLKAKVKMVICDSQVFESTSNDTPPDIFITSFSILFARYKGELKTFAKGASKISYLNDGDTVVISEACTHHRHCEDIGTVKLPAMLKKYTGKKLNFIFTSGSDFEFPPQTSLVIHCGGCMQNTREMHSRINLCAQKNVPVTNYGIAIAYIKNILNRSAKLFPEILS